MNEHPDVFPEAARELGKLAAAALAAAQLVQRQRERTANQAAHQARETLRLARFRAATESTLSRIQPAAEPDATIQTDPETAAYHWAQAQINRDHDPAAAQQWDEAMRRAGVDPDSVRMHAGRIKATADAGARGGNTITDLQAANLLDTATDPSQERSAAGDALRTSASHEDAAEQQDRAAAHEAEHTEQADQGYAERVEQLQSRANEHHDRAEGLRAEAAQLDHVTSTAPVGAWHTGAPEARLAGQGYVAPVVTFKPTPSYEKTARRYSSRARARATQRLPHNDRS